MITFERNHECPMIFSVMVFSNKERGGGSDMKDVVYSIVDASPLLTPLTLPLVLPFQLMIDN